MESTVTAIVLRRRDAGESDRRLTLLTRERGKIDAVAKGARKSGSRLAGTSDVLAVASFAIAEGKKNRFITQAQPMASFRGLRTDYDRLSLGLAYAELCATVLPFEEPFEEAFDLLNTALRTLEVHPKPVVASVWAQLQLLTISGFLPSFRQCAVTGERVKEAEPFASPRAGGYVSLPEALTFTDRIKTKAEVLFGLAKTAELDGAPDNLKFAEEGFALLVSFWRHIAEAPLPANESALQGVLHGHV